MLGILQHANPVRDLGSQTVLLRQGYCFDMAAARL